MNVQFQPRHIVGPLALFALFLLIAHGIGLLLRHYFGYEFAKGYVPLFNLDHERNVPSFFSSAILLIAVALLGCIVALVRQAQRRGRDVSSGTLPWLGLLLIFLYLSYDEAFSVHERAMEPTREMVGASGAFYYAWVIPYGILALTIASIYLRFVLRLPSQIRNLMVLSGALYVGGAIGMEMAAAYYFEAVGSKNLTHDLLATLEESMEISGVLLFIYTLLRHIEVTFPGLTFVIAPTSATSAAITQEPTQPFVQPVHTFHKP